MMHYNTSIKIWRCIMTKINKSYRLDEVKLAQLQAAVKKVNDHLGYKKWNETEVIETLIHEYIVDFVEKRIGKENM
jgi:hypothetical protein